MPRGQPDYGLYTATPVASGISDPGEAAARLGSINVYDRRGRTVWMDDFEEAILKWTDTEDGAGTLPVLSTIEAWMGIQSLYFVTRAANAAYARIERIFPLLRLGKFGIEFFVLLSTKTPGHFSASIRIADGTNISDAALFLDSEAQTATIATPDGDVPVATFCFNDIFTPTWIPVKLVVDMDTDRYVRLMIGPQEIDLPYQLVDPVIPSTLKYLLVRFNLVGNVAGAQTAYLDDFILTQNEP